MADLEDSETRVEAQGPGPGQMQALEVAGHEILLCNVDGQVYALANNCSHAKARLDAGRLEGHRLECPLHGAVFDCRSGEPLAPPARKPLPVYRVEQDPGGLVIRIPSRKGMAPTT